MDLNLTRIKANKDGLFGRFTRVTGEWVCFSLERLYDGIAKLPAGDYVCKRRPPPPGAHIPYECFEIQNVPGHTGICIHRANWEKDLDGCVGVGQQTNYTMISNSEKAFEEFMALQVGVDQFNLHVGEPPQISV